MKNAKFILLTLAVTMFASLVIACGSTETVEVVKEVEVIKEVEVVKEVVKEVEVEVEVEAQREKRELVFAGLDWDSAIVQTAVASYIVEHGYGYPVSNIPGSTVPLFQGLIKGDVDISMEIWLPNQDEAWAKGTKNGQVIGVGKSLEDNWQSTFVVHQHTLDANPGLVSATDLMLPEYQALFAQPDSGGKAVLVGCISGWACRGVNEAQIEVLGLSDYIELRDPGSQAGLFASIGAAGDKGEDWLGYMWGPTKPDAEYDLVPLEQPTNCGGDPKLGCGFGVAEILIATNISVIQDAPDVIAFLNKYGWPGKYQLPAEAWYSENKEKAEYKDDPGAAVSEWFLNEFDGWEAWVSDEAKANLHKALGH